jgi:two-component system sensor histidine kinase BaeS
MKRRHWIGSTLTVRVVLATCVVALVSVAITAGVAIPIALSEENNNARAVLAEKARVAASVVEGADTAAARARATARGTTIVKTLADQGIIAVLIVNSDPQEPGLPDRVVRQVSIGQPVSTRITYQGHLMLAEGRPAGLGDGIVLLQATTNVSIASVFGRIWIALVAGLLAGLLVGALLARRLGRPLRDVAVTARLLSAGDRRVRAPTNEPAEIADVAVALNDLAAALSASEARQRAFLMSVSHELRTPLTTIRGYAEALADGVVHAEGTQRAGQTMLAESEHLDRLIEDLLVLARLEADDFPLEVVPVDLTALVDSTAEAWAARCEMLGVGLHTELPGFSVVVRTDPGRLRQVLDGLLGNALRVVPAGARVVLAARPGGVGAVGFGDDPTRPFPITQPTRALPTRGGPTRALPVDPWAEPSPSSTPPPSLSAVFEPPTTQSESAPFPYGVVEVRDGGPGFTEDDLRVVFDQGALYERYKGVRKVGSGLGLALAARLVTRLGGRIEAGHAPEGGARFTVRMPMT